MPTLAQWIRREDEPQVEENPRVEEPKEPVVIVHRDESYHKIHFRHGKSKGTRRRGRK